MDKLITKTARRVRHLLASNSALSDPVFDRVNGQFLRARQLVQFYYLVAAFISYSTMSGLQGLVQSAEEWEFLWPIAWLTLFEGTRVIEWLPVATLFASLLAFQFPAHRIFRIAFAILCLFTVAAFNSQGSINHGFHVWLWIGIGLVFLPNVAPDIDVPRTVKMTYLSVVVAVQGLILFFYTLAGFWKSLDGLMSLLRGNEGNFSPRGLALQLADRMLQTGTSPLLGDLAIANFWLLWPLFLALIYIQLVAVIVCFRPRLHVAWGYLLIMFHLGTWLFMEIAFPHHVLFLGLLLVMSPFRPRHLNLWQTVRDLPVVGPLASIFRRKYTHGRASAVPAE